MNLKFGIRSSKTELRNGTLVHQCLIVVTNEEGLFVVHPLSNILLKDKSKKYNTQKSKAQAIVSFLNWYNENHFVFNEEEPRLSKLDFFKVEYFLNTLVEEGKSASTIASVKKGMISLLSFLMDNNMLEEEMVLEYQKRKLREGDFFELHSNPSRHSNNDLIHEIRKEYIAAFLDLAFKHVNPIALGVCMQIFGGLRSGDCVNLTRDSVTSKGAYGTFGLELDIKFRDLRPDLKDYDGSSGVKKPRRQVVFPNKFLPEFYEHHLRNYEDTSGKNALFIDTQGLPMTGRTYQYYFQKLKRIFIDSLLSSNNLEAVTYGMYLNSKKWSTHIGRGTFSNWISEATANPLDVALARGDSSLQSALTYMEHSESFMNGIHEVVNKMYEQAVKY